MNIFEFIKSFCSENDAGVTDIDNEAVIELNSLNCDLPSFRNYYHLLLNNSHLTSSIRLFLTMLHFSSNQLAILKVRNSSLRNYAYIGNTPSLRNAMKSFDMRLIDIVENSLDDIWGGNWLTLSADLRNQNLSLLPKIHNQQTEYQLLFLVSGSQVSEIRELCKDLPLSRRSVLSLGKIGAPSEYLYVAATENLCLN